MTVYSKKCCQSKGHGQSDNVRQNDLWKMYFMTTEHGAKR